MRQQTYRYYALHRPLTTGVGSKGQISCFSESSGVAYRIKRNEAYSMLAKNLSLNTLLIPGMRSNGQNSFFLKVVMLKKLKKSCLSQPILFQIISKLIFLFPNQNIC